MAIRNADRHEIRRSADFLERLGYSSTEDSCSIRYCRDNICIHITYPPNSDEGDIDIQFIKENEFFSLEWIALVRENRRHHTDRLENIRQLLAFLKRNYSLVTDYQYCKQSNQLVDAYVKSHWDTYKKAIHDFLDKD